MKKYFNKNRKLASCMAISLLFISSIQSLTGEITPTNSPRENDNIAPIILGERGDNVTYIVNLQDGWNLMSLPINQSIHKEEIMINYSGMDYTWQEAVDNSIVLGFIYQWNATNQNYGSTDTLQSGLGYWLYAFYDCELLAEGPSLGDGDCYWTQSGSDIYYNDGNVGIGTINPTAKLDVVGDTYISGNVTVSNGGVFDSVNISSSGMDVTGRYEFTGDYDWDNATIYHFGETAEYIVFKDSWFGGTCYAKNGTSGKIESSGSNASLVIQYAVDEINVSGGGLLYLKSGEYIIRSTIELCKEISVVGSGWNFGGGGTKLKQGANCDILRVAPAIKGVTSVGIFDLSIVSQRDAYSKGSAITFSSNCMDVRVSDVGINYMPEYGIISGNGWGMVIDDVVIENCGLDGLRITSGTEGKIVNCKINANDHFGAYISTTQSKILNNEFRGNGYDGLILNMPKIICIGNTFHGNHDGGYDSQLTVRNENCTVIGNNIDCQSYTAYGIRLWSTSSNVTVLGNNIEDFNTIAVKDYGDFNLLAYNVGFHNSTYNYIPCSGANPYGGTNNGAMYFNTGNQTLCVYWSGSWYYYEHGGV